MNTLSSTRGSWITMLAIGLLAFADLGISAPAEAAKAGGSVITIQTGGGGYSSEAILRFDEILSKAEQVEVRNRVGSIKAATSRTANMMPLAAPSGAQLYCNRFYNFGDPNGFFSVQHACAGNTAPWGFTLATSWCAIAVGTVAEHGMSWTRNGSGMPRQAPHTVSCDYLFHGTFNPGRDRDSLTYADVFTFRFVTPQGSGTAQLTIRGSFSLLAIPVPPR